MGLSRDHNVIAIGRQKWPIESQLNSASAGHAKIPVRLAVKYLQQATSTSIDKFGDDACFILNSKRKGMTSLRIT